MKLAVAVVMAVAMATAGCGGEGKKPDPGPAPRPEHRVEVKRQGEGRVRSTPPGIDCGNVCEARFPEETRVTLTGASTRTSSFFGWAGGGCKNGPGTCSFTLGEPTIVQAFFPRTREPRWQARLGGEGDEIATDLAVDAQGNPWLLVASWKNDLVVLSVHGFDTLGAARPPWKAVDTGAEGKVDAALAVGQDVVYLASATLPGKPSVAAFGPDGALRWDREIDSRRAGHPFALAVLPDGGVVVGGVGYLASYAADGKQRWLRPAPGIEIRAVAVEGKQIAVAGTLVARASFGGRDLGAGGGGTDAFVALLDGKGRVAWARRYGAGADDTARAIAFAAGDVAVAGAEEDGRPFVALLGASGEPRWWKEWPALPRTGVAADLVYAPDGRLHVTGSFRRAVTFGSFHLAAEEEDGFLVAYSLEGEVTAAQRLGSSKAAAPAQVAAYPAGGVVVASTFDERFDLAGGPQTSAGGTDVLIARLAP